MNDRKANISLFAISIITFLLIAIIVAGRSYLYNDDTYNYYFMFKNYGLDFRIEVGFLLLVGVLSSLFDSYQIYFFILFFILNFFFYLSFERLKRIKNDEFNIINDYSGVALVSLLAFCLMSSWYYTVSINGIRQGISISILFYAITFFVSRQWKVFAFLFLVSCSIHYSSILYLPFIFLLNSKGRKIEILFFIFAVLYFLNINEILIRTLSNLLSLPLYTMISEYGGDIGYRYGFQLDLFIYTVFWYVFTGALLNIGQVIYKNHQLELLYKLYGLLSMAYFVYGFGGYSNRYAIVAWLLLPFLQMVIFMSLKIGITFKFILCFFFLIFGVYSYLDVFYINAV